MKKTMNTHSFNVDLAKEIGIEGAILLQHFYYWYQNNKNKKTYKKDGRIWTYNTQTGLSEIFPYLNPRQIRHRMEKLITEEYILKGNYNKVAYDRTNWYTLSDKSLELFGESEGRKRPMEKAKTSNEKNENVEPIPNINSNINSNTLSSIEKESPILFNSPENSSALFQLDSKHNWSTITSNWITEESSSVLNAVYKKYFLKMDNEQQDKIVQFIKSLGSDSVLLKKIWISSFLKNGSDLDSLSNDINRKKLFNKTNGSSAMKAYESTTRSSEFGNTDENTVVYKSKSK